MYENVFGEITNDPTHGGGWDKPVLVLDLSPEARERRVEAGAKAIGRLAYKESKATDIDDPSHYTRKTNAEDIKFYAKYARAVLDAIYGSKGGAK